MEFLKSVLKEETYNALTHELKDSDIKLADLSTGEYVSKAKYDTAIKDIETHKEQLAQRDADLKNLKEKADLSDEQKQKFEELQTKYDSEKTEWETKFEQNAKNASWEISIAKLGVIDPVALKAHTKEFVEQAEFKDGQIVGFEEHATELLNDKLKYLVPTNKQSLGGKFEQTPPDKTVEDQVLSGFGLKE